MHGARIRDPGSALLDAHHCNTHHSQRKQAKVVAISVPKTATVAVCNRRSRGMVLMPPSSALAGGVGRETGSYTDNGAHRMRANVTGLL